MCNNFVRLEELRGLLFINLAEIYLIPAVCTRTDDFVNRRSQNSATITNNNPWKKIHLFEFKAKSIHTSIIISHALSVQTLNKSYI